MNSQTPAHIAHPKTIKSFVTRAGRTTGGQAKALAELGPRFVLPFQHGVFSAEQAFGRIAPLILEIGFGMGDATAQIALVRPDDNFLCCEVHEPGVGALLNPLVSAFRYLPATAFIPLFLMWLGAGESQKLALLVVGVVFFLISLLMDNTLAVRTELIETARTLGASRRQILWKIVLPASLPGYLDTLRQMLAVGWTYLVVAEIVATTDGIGAMMMRAKRFVHVDEIMAGIVVIGALGVICDGLFRLVRWLVCPYLKYQR